MHGRSVDLNDSDWRLGQAPIEADPAHATWSELDKVREWLPARVPGNVRSDLIRNGRLPDLHCGMGPEAAQWVDDHCWWFAGEPPITAAPGERVYLVLRGVDYLSDLFLNGQHLGRHEGMFSPQVHDITSWLGTENRLAVRIVGSRWLPCDRSSRLEKLLNQIEGRLGSLPDRFPHRRDNLKCQMSYGWDFAPPLRTMGIWDDVYAVVTRGVLIRGVSLSHRMIGKTAFVTVQVTVEAHEGQSARLCVSLTGDTFEAEPLGAEQPVELPAGASTHRVEVTVHQPHLWWPWDHGSPDLYRLAVEVRDSSGRLDSVIRKVGLRQVELEGWTLGINGRRIYVRGANWVPADLLPGRVKEADYRALLTLAHQANMNMLRVWGGGLREKRAFYDSCDRLGILVWQEFPFACASLTRLPRSQGYLQLVESEARDIVRDLRHHASLALWCGGNEFSPERNLPVVSTLERVIAREDPTRPFLAASPANGDSHNWHVWHQFHPPSSYLRDQTAFATEFGLQAPPAVEVLERFLPSQGLWPPGPAWTYHGAGLRKLDRYAQPFLINDDPSLNAFVRASQQAQARGLQIAIEHYRRRKAEGCGGVLLWQLNEPWPAISWALVDFYRNPKPAYDMVKRLFAPLLVSIEYAPARFRPGDRLCTQVWIINDQAQAIPACQMEVVLWNRAREAVNRFARSVDISPDSAEVVGSFCWSLPSGGGWRLTSELIRDGQLLAMNEYDLATCDDIKPTLRQRLRSWLASQVTPT